MAVSSHRMAQHDLGDLRQMLSIPLDKVSDPTIPSLAGLVTAFCISCWLDRPERVLATRRHAARVKRMRTTIPPATPPPMIPAVLAIEPKFLDTRNTVEAEGVARVISSSELCLPVAVI
jgi:hypothetical protein